MAKFVFNMESILSIKEKLEEQAKAEYAVEMIKLREEEEKYQTLCRKKEFYQEKLKEAVRNILDLLDIRKLENHVENVKYNMKVQYLVVLEQQRNVDLAREKLNESMKERKIFEKLKEKAFQAFCQEVNLQEQKEIDELVSFRFGNGKESED